MRYKLVIENKEENPLPIDYPYLLNHVIEQNSEEFFPTASLSRELLMNLISYSPFLAKNKEIDGTNNYIKFFSQRIYWILSSPVGEHVVACSKKIFVDKKIEISGHTFSVIGILKMHEPEFKSKMKFICLSPISIIKKVINQRKNFIYYDYTEDISPIIKNILEDKYRNIYKQEPPSAPFKITLDNDYINKRGGRITKLVNIVEKDGFVRKIKGIFAPFEIEGAPELIKLGYFSGFGDFTQYGFGLVDLVPTIDSAYT